MTNNKRLDELLTELNIITAKLSKIRKGIK